MKHDPVIVAGAHMFTYDPATGDMERQGRPVKSVCRQGYVRVKLLGFHVQGHRLAWFLHYGELPVGEIDHVNGHRSDNRLSNLRDVDRSLNRMNQRLRSDNSSGVPGVTFHRTERKWHAQICVRGVRQYLGRYATRHEAVEARLAAQARLPFGPNHGARA